ncbi:hypothetical protein AHF37_01963 [Paragonimus kellicotti]|nr:hypothetical protein AHF37_01963 [Paragonimus kellicotti]
MSSSLIYASIFSNFCRQIIQHITLRHLFLGLDIPQVNLIINWNMPLTCSGSADCETYLHRIGRSGRFGKNGVAVNFITDEELDVLHELEDYFDIKISPLTTEDLLDV